MSKETKQDPIYINSPIITREDFEAMHATNHKMWLQFLADYCSDKKQITVCFVLAIQLLDEEKGKTDGRKLLVSHLARLALSSLITIELRRRFETAESVNLEEPEP